MPWVMTQRKVGSEYHFFVGSIKVCEICFLPEGRKWRVYVRYWGATEIVDFENMSDALKDMHRRLNEPPNG